MIRSKFNDYFIDSIIEIEQDIDAVGLRNINDGSMIASKFRFRRVSFSLQEITEIINSFKSDIGGKRLLTYGVLKIAVEIIAYF